MGVRTRRTRVNGDPARIGWVEVEWIRPGEGLIGGDRHVQQDRATHARVWLAFPSGIQKLVVPREEAERLVDEVRAMGEDTARGAPPLAEPVLATTAAGFVSVPAARAASAELDDPVEPADAPAVEGQAQGDVAGGAGVLRCPVCDSREFRMTRSSDGCVQTRTCTTCSLVLQFAPCGPEASHACA